jgi:hypothetical protein
MKKEGTIITLYEIPVNEKLFWDYKFSPNEYQTEKIFCLYLSKVLTIGSDADIKSVGIEVINNYLHKLNIPRRIKNFWQWYFDNSLQERYGNINTVPKTNS